MKGWALQQPVRAMKGRRQCWGGSRQPVAQAPSMYLRLTCMYVIAGRRLVQQEALPLLPPPAPPPPLPQQQPQQSAEPPLGVVVGRQARAERIEQTNSESASLLHARFEGCAR